MHMKKNEIIRGICENYTNEGYGVIKIEGIPIFVKELLQGEEADVLIIHMKKTYGFGKIQKLHKNSANRQEQPCIYAKSCGGCQLQHMVYDEQCNFKQKKIKEALMRIGNIHVEMNSMIQAEQIWNYRNKTQIPIGMKHDQVITGFYRIHSNDIIDMNACMIQSEIMNSILQTMKALFKKYEIAHFFKHLLMKHAVATDEVMVVFIVKDKNIMNLADVVLELTDQIPNIKSIMLNINKRNDNVILGKEEIVIYGNAYITDRLLNMNFQISMKSFYQVNPKQTEKLYQKVLEFAKLTNEETVLDLYCGVGTISLLLAKYAKQVIGVEIVEEAIQSAKQNAELNKIRNIEFVCKDAKEFTTLCLETEKEIDVIVVDPPRKGCDEETISSMIALHPNKIVYVSCDPATLARDLNKLVQANYDVVKVQPVDLFPNTIHVECVVLMTRKDD